MAKLSKKKVKQAIEGSLGSVTIIADRCRVARGSIYGFFDKHPEFKDMAEKERDIILDKAENNLHNLVNKGDWKATEFLLKTQGAKRGYAPIQILDNRHSSTIDADDFSKAYKAAMAEKNERKEPVDAEFKELEQIEHKEKSKVQSDSK